MPQTPIAAHFVYYSMASPHFLFLDVTVCSPLSYFLDLPLGISNLLNIADMPGGSEQKEREQKRVYI